MNFEHCVSLVLAHVRVFCALEYPKQIYFIMSLLILVASSATCALDCSPYSRWAEGKSTAEPNFISIPRAALEENEAPAPAEPGQAPSHRSTGGTRNGNAAVRVTRPHAEEVNRQSDIPRGSMADRPAAVAVK